MSNSQSSQHEGNVATSSYHDNNPGEQLLYHFTDLTPGGVYLGYWEPSGLYTRHCPDVLGCNDTEYSDQESQLQRGFCFNCGSSTHAVSGCPHPRNHSLITLSRDLFHFLKSQSHTDHIELKRIHEVEGWKQQRLEWADAFVPGEIRGELLREALGAEANPAESLSAQEWLRNMAIWGYPPGWVGARDPKDAMRSRILQEDVDSDEFTNNDIDDEPFKIFGDTEEPEHLDFRLFAPTASAGITITDLREDDFSVLSVDTTLHSDMDVNSDLSSTLSSNSNTGDSDSLPQHPRSRRWARYPETHFSSNLLPVYTGMALPPIDAPPGHRVLEYICDSMWYNVVYGRKPWDDAEPPPPSTTPPPLPPSTTPPPPPPPPCAPPPLPPSPSPLPDQGEGNGETDMVLPDSE